MVNRFVAAGMTALMMSVSPLTLTVSVPAIAQEAAASEEQDGKVTLTEMTSHTERLVANLIRLSRLSEDEALDIKSETGKPYWTSLRALNEAVGKMANGAALKDKTFHEGLSETVREGSAFIAAYELSGAEDEKIEKVTTALEENVTTLYDAFSKASARAKEGKELTAEEKERLEKIKTQQVELQRRLDAMEKKVKNNKRAVAGLEEVRRRSRDIYNSGSNVGDFLAALIALRILDGLIWGCHPWWGPWGVWYADYSVVIVDVYDDYYDAVPYDWDYYGDYEIDYDLALADDPDFEMGDADMLDNFDYLDSADIDYDGELSDEALDGLEVPTEEDFANEDFGLDEAMLDDSGADLNIADDAETGEIGGLESLTNEDLMIENSDPLVEEMAPIAEDVSPMVENVAPVIENDIPVVDTGPADMGGFDDGYDGFDSFDGGGFDDMGGGFDDW